MGALVSLQNTNQSRQVHTIRAKTQKTAKDDERRRKTAKDGEKRRKKTAKDVIGLVVKNTAI